MLVASGARNKMAELYLQAMALSAEGSALPLESNRNVKWSDWLSSFWLRRKIFYLNSGTCSPCRSIWINTCSSACLVLVYLPLTLTSEQFSEQVMAWQNPSDLISSISEADMPQQHLEGVVAVEMLEANEGRIETIQSHSWWYLGQKMASREPCLLLGFAGWMSLSNWSGLYFQCGRGWWEAEAED